MIRESTDVTRIFPSPDNCLVSTCSPEIDTLLKCLVAGGAAIGWPLKPLHISKIDSSSIL